MNGPHHEPLPQPVRKFVAPKITHAQWSKFSLEVEENLPSLCGIDLVLFSETTSALQEQVEQQGIVIYDQAA